MSYTAGGTAFDETGQRVITNSAPPTASKSGTGGIDAPVHSTSDLQFQKKVYAIGDNQSAFTGLSGFAGRFFDESPSATSEKARRVITNSAPPTASKSGTGGIDAPVHSTSDLQFQKKVYAVGDNQSAFTGLTGFGGRFFDESPSATSEKARRVITNSAPPIASEGGAGGINAPIHSTSDLQVQKKVYAVGDNQSAFSTLPGFGGRFFDDSPSTTTEKARRLVALPSEGGSGLPRDPGSVDGTVNALAAVRGSSNISAQSSESATSVVAQGGSSDLSVSASLTRRRSGAVTMGGAGAVSGSGAAKVPDIATLSASLGGSGGLSGGRGGSSIEPTLRLETDDLLDRFIENNPNLGLLINRGEITAQVARAILTSVKSFIREVETERQQQFVATASGDGLDQFGELVGARRQPGEGDAAMRTRVRAGFGRATSETTIEDLAQVTRTITDASASEIQIEPPVDDVLVVIVRVNSGVLNDSPFGINELGEFLSEVVPASHAVEVRTSGTFVLDGPNFTPPPNSGLGDGNGTLGGTSG